MAIRYERIKSPELAAEMYANKLTYVSLPSKWAVIEPCGFGWNLPSIRKMVASSDPEYWLYFAVED